MTKSNGTSPPNASEDGKRNTLPFLHEEYIAIGPDGNVVANANTADRAKERARANGVQAPLICQVCQDRDPAKSAAPEPEAESERETIELARQEILRCLQDAEPAINSLIRAAVAKRFPNRTFDEVVAVRENAELISETRRQAVGTITKRMQARLRIIEWMQEEGINFEELRRLAGFSLLLHDESEAPHDRTGTHDNLSY